MKECPGGCKCVNWLNKCEECLRDETNQNLKDMLRQDKELRNKLEDKHISNREGTR